MDFRNRAEELEALGYTVSDSGKNILKEGRAIAGETPEGNVWSGSRELTALLKGKEPKKEPAPKPVPKEKTKGLGSKPKAKASRSQETPTATSVSTPTVYTSKLPKAGTPQGGRGDGRGEWNRRGLDHPKADAGASVSPTSTTTSKGPSTKPLVLRGTLAGTKYAGEGKFTESEWRRMTRAERKKNGLPVSVLGGATFKGWK